MRIYDYITRGGKNVIKEYLNSLPKDEKEEGYNIRHNLSLNGIEYLHKLNIKPLRGKLWEIKFSKNRIMYVLADNENIYFFHACQKQKGKAEKFELDTAIKRAKEEGFKI